jgi:hypothetical protein
LIDQISFFLSFQKSKGSANWGLLDPNGKPFFTLGNTPPGYALHPLRCTDCGFNHDPAYECAVIA